MNASRNRPCPCGSGKKYKRCCMAEDQTRRSEAPLTPGDRARAAEIPVWQAEATPFPARFENDRAARPVTVIVMAGDVALSADMLRTLSGEPEDVASALADEVLAAAERVGRRPGELHVRHAEVAEHLVPLLAPEGIDVRAVTRLDHVAPFARLLNQGVGGVSTYPAVSSPDVWEGWGFPTDRIAELFGAGAAFFRATPWLWMSDSETVEAEMPGGRHWLLSIMGHGGQEFGIAMHSDPGDFEKMFEGGGASDVLERIEGRIVALTFGDRGELPRRMQREVASQGWEVAAPEAYPLLVPVNTPGGGMRSSDLSDLTALLGAVARWVEASPADGPGESSWTDPESGVSLRPLARSWVARPPTHFPDPPDLLEPGGPEGPAADPAPWRAGLDDPEVLTEEGLDVLAGFYDHLEREGLSSATVERHVRNAVIFVRCLTDHQGVLPSGVHEYDLRTFLYDWYPRNVWDSETRARAVPTSLKRFFRYLELEGVHCPWAAPILRDKETFETRRRTCPFDFERVEEATDWLVDFTFDLDARALLPGPGLGGAGSFGLLLGPSEFMLHEELQRRWLTWRDEAIREGLRSPESVEAALIPRQRAWEQAPHPEYGDRTPLQVVEKERREGPELEDF